MKTNKQNLPCVKCKNTNTIKNGIMKGQQRYKCRECSYTFTNSSVERKKTPTPPCIECQSNQTVRRGSAKGEQRYYCKDCSKQFTKLSGRDKRTMYSVDLKVKAFSLYKQGHSYQQISVLLGANINTAKGWIRNFPPALLEIYRKERKQTKLKLILERKLSERKLSERKSFLYIKKKNKIKVFLGGTNTQWRNRLIPKLKINYFSPTLDERTDDCIAEENSQRQNCDAVLFLITPKVTKIIDAYLIAEAVDSSHDTRYVGKTIFCFINSYKKTKFSVLQLESLYRIGEIIQGNNGIVASFDNIEKFVDYTSGLLNNMKEDTNNVVNLNNINIE